MKRNYLKETIHNLFVVELIPICSIDVSFKKAMGRRFREEYQQAQWDVINRHQKKLLHDLKQLQEAAIDSQWGEYEKE